MPQQPVSERIKILLNTYANGNKAELGRAGGVSGQAIADLIEGKKGGPSFPVIQKLLTSFPDVRAEWLILGEGEMTKSEENPAGSPKDLSYTPSRPVASAGENSIASSMGIGEPVTMHGITVPTYTMQPSKKVGKAASATSPPAAPEPEPPGLDLVRQVAQNTADIKRLLALHATREQATQ